jgi:hypothetical protein
MESFRGWARLTAYSQVQESGCTLPVPFVSGLLEAFLRAFGWTRVLELRMIAIAVGIHGQFSAFLNVS